MLFGGDTAQIITVTYATVGLILTENRTGMIQAEDLWDFQNVVIGV